MQSSDTATGAQVVLSFVETRVPEPQYPSGEQVRAHRSDTVLENLLNHGTYQNGLCEGEYPSGLFVSYFQSEVEC